MHPLTPKHIKELLTTANNEKYDLIPLEREPRSLILPSLIRSHGPDATYAWNSLLIGMEFTITQLEVCNYLYAFWRSAYLIRPTVLRKLTELMVKAMNLVEDNADLTEAFVKDARYSKGSEVVAKQVFNTSYYQMHPFVFERLPSFFLSTFGGKIADLYSEEYKSFRMKIKPSRKAGWII